MGGGLISAEELKDMNIPLLMLLLLLFLAVPHMACGILVPRPGIEPRPSAVRVQSPNHWTAREVPVCSLRGNQDAAPRLHYCFLTAPPLSLHPFPD